MYTYCLLRCAVIGYTVFACILYISIANTYCIDTWHTSSPHVQYRFRGFWSHFPYMPCRFLFCVDSSTRRHTPLISVLIIRQWPSELSYMRCTLCPNTLHFPHNITYSTYSSSIFVVISPPPPQHEKSGSSPAPAGWLAAVTTLRQ